MIRQRRRIIHWLPRVLAVLFIILISLFALDVFGQGYGFFGTVWALFIHLIPSIILIAITKIAWKMEIYGGFLFILLGIIFTFLTWGKLDTVTYLLLPGMAMLIGVLFWLSRVFKKKERDLLIC